MVFFWLVRGAAVSVAATAFGCASRSASPAMPERGPCAPVASAPATLPAVSPPPAPLASAAPTPAPTPAPSAAAPPIADARAPRPAGSVCGGFAGFQCEAKLYCAFPVTAHCGAGDMAGTCQPKPELCTDLYAAVCGCDGKTYPNACYAQRAGVSVASNGACKP